MAKFKYEEVMNITRICEYMYRKGIYDASKNADRDTLEMFAERDENYIKLGFLEDCNGEDLGWQRYSDFLQMICGQLKAWNLRNYLAYTRNTDMLKRSLCVISNYYYLLGLKEWDTESENQAFEYFNKVIEVRNIERKGTKRKVADFLDEIKHKLNEISYTHRENDVKINTRKLAITIGQAVFEKRVDL